jgi:hypothetical protein
MIGFVLPPAHEIYHYMNDNELQAFLDIVAVEIDRYFGETFTAEQLDAFNYPCYRFIAKDIQDVSATLPDGLFRLFLDRTLTYKQSGGGLNLRNSNKYATAEFKENSDVGESMRGGYSDQEKDTILEEFKGTANISGVPRLNELRLKSNKNADEADKQDIKELLAYVKAKDIAVYAKLFKALYGAPPPPPGPGPNAPSSAAASASSASAPAASAPAASAPAASASAASAPAASAAVPAAQNAVASSNRQIVVSKAISSALINYLPPDIAPEAKLAISTALAQLGDKQAFGLMEYASSVLGNKISMIGGGLIIFQGINGSRSQMTLDNVLQIVASRRGNASTLIENQIKAKFLLGHIRAQEQFFIKIREEMTTHKGENIIAALRNFFEQFKPTMVDAVAFAEAEQKYINKIKEKQKKLISEYSMFSSTYIKNENLNTKVSSVQKSYNIRRSIFGGAGALSSFGGAAFHLYRRGYASAVGRVTGWTKATPPPPPPTQSASRPQRFQEEAKMHQKCSANQRVILKPGEVADYGTIVVAGQPARTEQQTICTPGRLWGQNCQEVTVQINATVETTRPRTVAEAGAALPQNAASQLQCVDIVCAEGLAWNNNKQECEARACGGVEQAFVQSGIDPKTLDGIGQCQVAKAPRMGEELSWGQFAYSFIPFTGGVKARQVPCDQAGPTNVQCWSSWLQNKQVDIGRGLGTFAGYTLEAGGAGIQFASSAIGVTGDLTITGGLVHGTRRSVEWTYRGWKQFEIDKSEIEEMKDFVIEMNRIKTQLNEQIEIATFQYMVAQFFKYILPQIEELRLGFTTKVTMNNKGNPVKNKNGKIIREEFEQGTPEAIESNERILAYLSSMISIDKMNALWDKLKLQEKYEQDIQSQFRETRPGGLLLTANSTAPSARQAFAGFNQAAPQGLTAKDWFELFLPHFMSSILKDLQQIDTKGEAGSTLMERVKRTIAHNIKVKNNSLALKQIRTLENQLTEATKGKTGFEKILEKYDTITKGRGADQISADFSYVVSCFQSAGQSYKAKQEAAAAAAALQKQKEETDKRLAAEQAAAVQAATAPLQAQLQATQRERNAAQRERNATAAAAAQRERNATAAAAAQRERNATAAAAAAKASAPVAALPASVAPVATTTKTGNTAGGQIRNRETRRRRSGGKRKVNRKTRRSRRY